MYELAFRYAVGKPVIIIAQQGTKLPFDVQGDRVILYANDMAGAAPLKAALQDSVNSIDFEDTTPRSPIHTLLANYRFEQQVINVARGDEEKELLKMILGGLDRIEDRARTTKSDNGKGSAVIDMSYDDVVIILNRRDLLDNSFARTAFREYRMRMRGKVEFADIDIDTYLSGFLSFLEKRNSKNSKETP